MRIFNTSYKDIDRRSPLRSTNTNSNLLATTSKTASKHAIIRTVKTRVKYSAVLMSLVLIGLIGLALKSTAAPTASTKSKPASQLIIKSATVKVVPPATSVDTTALSNSSVDPNTSGSSGGSTSTSVTVNGQSVSVPANGSTQQTITDANGKTTVNITSNQSTSGTSSSAHRSTIHNSTSSTVITNVDNSSP